jgi:predicted dehydrogenase
MAHNPMLLGIVGCGVISETYLQRAAQSDVFKVKSVTDRIADAANRQAQQFNVEAVSFDAMLADPDIDLIINLTVPNAHFEVSKDILSADKHAYSEKPIAVTLEQGKALLELADARNLRLGCAPDTFLGGGQQACRALIDEGQIGDVLGGALTCMTRGMEHWHPNPDFFFKPGGGPVLDQGPYYITQLVNLLGAVKSVSALATIGYAERIIGSGTRTGEKIKVEIPTYVTALLTMATGVSVTLDLSWDIWRSGRAPVEIYGTKGTLQGPDPSHFGGVPRISHEGAAWNDIDISAYPYSANNRTLRSGAMAADYRSAGIVDMVQAIRENRPHRASGALAVHVLDVMEAIALAAEEKREVLLETKVVRPKRLTLVAN